ncbi:MAG: hypothetical protein ABI432_08615 [Flavobacteriales bacterium]
MTHTHGDTIISLVFGCVAAIAAHLAHWIEATTWMGDILHSGILGLVGGVMGYLGKRLIVKLTTKNDRSTNDQQ